jgi:hypothetical protein
MMLFIGARYGVSSNVKGIDSKRYHQLEYKREGYEGKREGAKASLVSHE